jgi:hypothetical protein
MLKRIFKLEWEEVKSIGLAQDGDKLWAFVNTVMNISVPQKWDIFLVYGKLNFLMTLL